MTTPEAMTTPTEGRRNLERVLLGLIAGGPILAVPGLALVVVRGSANAAAGTYAAALGLVVTVVSMGLSYALGPFRVILRRRSGGARYDELRSLGRLKTSAVLLNLLWCLGLLVLAVGALNRAGLADIGISGLTSSRLFSLGATILLGNLTYVHILCLRAPAPRARNYPVAPFVLIGVAATATSALFAGLIAQRSFDVGAGIRFGPADAAVFLFAAAVFASISLGVAKPLPNLLTLVRSDLTPNSTDYISRTKSVLLPAIAASGLLLLVLLALLLVGVGTTGIRSPVQATVLLLVGLGMVASVLVSVRLARAPDMYELYRRQQQPETREARIILAASLSAAVLLALLSADLYRGGHVAFLTPSRWMDVAAVALLVGLGPYGFYIRQRQRRIRRLEERFPDFLRDVAASHRGGLTLTSAVQIASQGSYGELTPEIRKMADQLSWDIPFDEALADLNRRVRTPLIERAISLIVEASRSGGNTTDVLIAAARDAREIKNLENERRQTMGLYSVIIDITFLVFLVVTAVLYGQLVPQIIKAANSTSLVSGESLAGIDLDVPSKAEYRSFYFLSAVVQGVGNGLLGGLFQTGRVSTGLRHAFMMVLTAYITFTFLLR